jgi:serine phosphatase RsbU (regulator of sigma subunit)
VHNGQVIGVIDSEHPENDFYSEDDIEILTTISSMSAAKIIQTQYLEELNTYKNELEDLVKDRTRKLEETIRSVEEKTREIRLKNKDLTDSMIYARRIQKSILPSLNAMETVFTRFFLYFKPKEIVSGDFYWAKKQEHNLYFAVADCTGHGVPGALLSIMGYNALNTVFNDKVSADPAEILNGLRTLIVENLRDVDEQKLHDGMDIGLCVYDANRKSMSFAGANNSVLIVRKGELIEFQGSKQSIGFHEHYISYITHSVQIEPGDSVYLFSDGYKDQFGGENKKKYKSANFKQLLINCSEFPIDERKEMLHQNFIKWTSGSEQVDDICVLGVDF